MRVLLHLLLQASCLMFIADVVAQSHSEFVINGQLKNVHAEAVIYLQYRDRDIVITDSVILRNGEFIMRGSIRQPVKAIIWMRHPGVSRNNNVRRDESSFYLEPGVFRLTGGRVMNEANIQGMGEQKTYKALKQVLTPFDDELKKLWAERQKSEEAFPGDKRKSDSLSARSLKLAMDRHRASMAFIKSHPDAQVSLDILEERSFLIENLPEFDSCFQSLSDRLKGTETGKSLASKIQIEKRTLPGQKALPIGQNTPLDSLVSLASIKGKYVLVDFWASWCGPCREENPQLVKSYHQFKNKNFEVYAVSLDSKKAPWIQAIAEDQLPWIHVSELKGWKNTAAADYGIRAVPQNVLIDPSGVIIAKNLSGEELNKKLSSLLNP